MSFFSKNADGILVDATSNFATLCHDVINSLASTGLLLVKSLSCEFSVSFISYFVVPFGKFTRLFFN